MRVAFMGTPGFAAGILRALAGSHQVAGVYTRPDAVRGRGRALMPSAVKEVALELGLPIFEPNTLRDADVQRELAKLCPDVICVAAYGAILPAEVLSLPRFGCVNVHASLLPRWRGAAPVERAILSGDNQTGVCVMRMEEGLDTGAVCVRRSTEIGAKSAKDLTAELSELGADALLEALSAIEDGSAVWVDQAEDGIEYAHKIDRGELDLNPNDGVQVALRKVRASGAAHPTKCRIAGKGVTVLSTRTAPAAQGIVQQGRVVLAGKRLLLGCADGAIELTEVKPDGKKAMPAAAFAAGVQGVKSGDIAWEGLRG